MPGKTVRWFKRIRTRGKQFDCAPRMRPSRLLEDGVSLSRRDLTMVARHEMPGMGAITDPSGKGRYDFVPRLNHAPDQKSAVCRPNHTVPLGRALSLTSSRHFMPGYPHSVPPGRSACSLIVFNTSSSWPAQESLDAATYVMPLGVHFWSQENFQRVLPR